MTAPILSETGTPIRSFEDWLAKLDALAGDTYGPGKCSDNTGSQCWRDYYDGGHSPADALAEDLSYGPL